MRWVDRNSLAEVETEFLEIRALFYVSVGGVQRQEGAQDGLGAVTHLVRAMFIIMGALVRTGALDVLTRLAERSAKTHPKTAVAGVILSVMAASAIACMAGLTTAA